MLKYTKSSCSKHYIVYYEWLNSKGEKRQSEKVFRNKDEALEFANKIYNSIYVLIGMTEELRYDYLFEEENNE